MKRIKFKYVVTIFAIIILLASVILAMRVSYNRKANREAPDKITPLTAPDATRTDRLITTAESRIKQQPSKADGYNLLASAYIRKARESGDFSLNARAESAINQALEKEPDNYEAIQLKAILMLTFHRFSEGLEIARQAQQMRPKDSINYGAMTDALVELGRYEEADKAIESMISLRPDPSSYARQSYLYFLHGDNQMAITVMRAAVKASTPNDLEGLAWYRIHLGEELMKVQKLNEAEREFDLALEDLPDYHLALAAKARARVADGDLQTAIEYYKRAQMRVPLPDTAMALCDLYTKTGQIEEAKKQFDFVEFIEKSGSKGADTYSRQLALFRANHDTRLDEALEIMKHERSLRRDIYTCDVLAWCFLKKGETEAAKTAIAEALRLGTRDAQIHYHAGMIYNALGDKQRAVKHLQLALDIDPMFDVIQSDIARTILADIKN